MAIRFERIEAGMVLYDVHSYRMGNTMMSRLGKWDVRILSVDTEKREARVSWNGNPAETWVAHRLQKLYREPPKRYREQRPF